MRFNNFLRRNKRKQRGLTLVETAMVLGVIAISMAGLSKMMADNARSTRVKASAERIIEVTGAVERYVNANYTQLTTLATAGNPIVIPVGKECPTCAVPGGPGGLNSIQGAGFLNNTFVDRNSADQRHAVLIREPVAGELEVLITTWGGNEFPDQDLGNISGLVGSGGGAVYANNPNAPSNQVAGSYGGWSTNVANWTATWNGNAVGPSQGRVAVALGFSNNGGNMNDYLNRFDTGDPEANKRKYYKHKFLECSFRC
jgi:type II secretory pathway pseudopilin PulG